MALPKVLKMMSVFVDGDNWIGEVNSATLPTLGRQMEEYRGSYARPVKLDLGGTGLELEIKTAGRKSPLVTKLGQALIDGNAVRFVGAYQSDDDGAYSQAEIYVRGRVEELNRGESKVGDVGEETTKLTLVYYREAENGRVLAEIDILNHVEIIDGVDRLAQARGLIGL